MNKLTPAQLADRDARTLGFRVVDTAGDNWQFDESCVFKKKTQPMSRADAERIRAYVSEDGSLGCRLVRVLRKPPSSTALAAAISERDRLRSALASEEKVAAGHNARVAALNDDLARAFKDRDEARAEVERLTKLLAAANYAWREENRARCVYFDELSALRAAYGGHSVETVKVALRVADFVYEGRDKPTNHYRLGTLLETVIQCVHVDRAAAESAPVVAQPATTAAAPTVAKRVDITAHAGPCAGPKCDAPLRPNERHEPHAPPKPDAWKVAFKVGDRVQYLIGDQRTPGAIGTLLDDADPKSTHRIRWDDGGTGLVCARNLRSVEVAAASEPARVTDDFDMLGDAYGKAVGRDESFSFEDDCIRAARGIVAVVRAMAK
jgi:hypothetical protein